MPLHAFNTQSSKITLVPPVLPRLLARGWLGLSFRKNFRRYHYQTIYTNQENHSQAQRQVNYYKLARSSINTLPKILHCCQRWGPFSAPMWLAAFPNQLSVITQVHLYYTKTSCSVDLIPTDPSLPFNIMSPNNNKQKLHACSIFHTEDDTL